MSGSRPISRPRAWVMAARPRTLWAGAAPVLVGTGLADAHGTYRFLPAVAALIGALLIQIGTNLANDYYDFARRGDTEDRVGPLRVTQAGLIPPSTYGGGWPSRSLPRCSSESTSPLVGGWPIVCIGSRFAPLRRRLHGWALPLGLPRTR